MCKVLILMMLVGVKCDDDITLTTATRRDSTSAKPTTFFRRINVEKVVPLFNPTLDLLELGSSEARRSHSTVWNWDFYCRLQPKKGNCSLNLIRYYYHAQLDQCTPFSFAGCNGNKNNFNSIDDCDRYCKGAIYMPLNVTEMSAACGLQPHSGYCLGLSTQYYYDINERTCKTFMYGGCGGNANRFDTLMKCVKHCAE